MRDKSPYSIKRRFAALLILTTIPFIILLAISDSILYTNIRRNIQRQIEGSTQSLHRLIEFELATGIRTYLRAKVETGRDIVERYLKNDPESAIPGTDAFKNMTQELLSLHVGESGYFYAVNGTGTMVFHPESSIIGENLHTVQPIAGQINNPEGYLEYLWQNPGEDQPRKKALYMEYIPEMDWILTASAYRSEFTDIIDKETLTEAVLSISPGRNGYSYIFGRDGVIIAHPYLTRDKLINTIGEEHFHTVTRQMFEQKEGYFSYLWKDSPEQKLSEKIVYLRYLPDFDWIVGTAVFSHELTRPVQTLMLISIGSALALAVLLYLSLRKIYHDLAEHLAAIQAGLAEVEKGNLSYRMAAYGPREMRKIYNSMNTTITSLEQKTKELSFLNESLQERVIDQSEALKKSTDNLMEAEKQALASRLIAGVAHEINTPVGIALTAVTHKQSLLNKLQEDFAAGSLSKTNFESFIHKSGEAADIAVRNLIRAGELIKSFKNVSSDQMALDERKVNLRQVVAETLLSLKPLLKNRNITVANNVDDIELITFPGVLIHLIVNLVTNSLDHGFARAEHGKIEIQGKTEENTAILEYRDNGTGIQEQIIPHIFNPFYTTRRGQGNTGLGLNIVQSLIKEKLHGTIEVESVEGEYTLFRVNFPCQMD